MPISIQAQLIFVLVYIHHYYKQCHSTQHLCHFPCLVEHTYAKWMFKGLMHLICTDKEAFVKTFPMKTSSWYTFRGTKQEFNMGISSHLSITLWSKPCSCVFLCVGGREGAGYLTSKLGVPTNYPLAWMFFFHTLATAFPTSYQMKDVCSCWVWKVSNDACHSTLFPVLVS